MIAYRVVEQRGELDDDTGKEIHHFQGYFPALSRKHADLIAEDVQGLRWKPYTIRGEYWQLSIERLDLRRALEHRAWVESWWSELGAKNGDDTLARKFGLVDPGPCAGRLVWSRAEGYCDPRLKRPKLKTEACARRAGALHVVEYWDRCGVHWEPVVNERHAKALKMGPMIILRADNERELAVWIAAWLNVHEISCPDLYIAEAVDRDLAPYPPRLGRRLVGKWIAGQHAA